MPIMEPATEPRQADRANGPRHDRRLLCASSSASTCSWRMKRSRPSAASMPTVPTGPGNCSSTKSRMAKAQDAEHWQVDAKVTPCRRRHGRSRHRRARRIGRAAQRHDRNRACSRVRPTGVSIAPSPSAKMGPATSAAAPTIGRGQWDLILELSRQGNRLFRSKNRVVIK